MQRLRQTPTKIIGLMSGTSLDGLDIALLSWNGKDPGEFQLEAFETADYPDSVRQDIHNGIKGAAEDVCRINFDLGTLWADSVNNFLDRQKISPEQINCIASHGQTIWHESGASTLQVGEPALLSEKTNIPVISNFRERDIAAGGTGAPLIPYLDWILFKELDGNSISLNLGGIANITCIQQDLAQEKVRAWDTGPGNMVVNSVVEEYYGTDPGYDSDGEIASSGEIIPELLAHLLDDVFLNQKPPKSTGREYYSEAYVDEKVITPAAENNWNPEDVVRTVSEWTVSAVAKNVHAFWKPIPDINRVIISGGGAFNKFFVERLASHFPNADILPSNEYKIPVEAKEAIGFAILGYAFIHELCANMPAVTGASKNVILGKLTP